MSQSLKISNFALRAQFEIVQQGGKKFPPPCLMYHKKGPCLLRLNDKTEKTIPVTLCVEVEIFDTANVVAG